MKLKSSPVFLNKDYLLVDVVFREKILFDFLRSVFEKEDFCWCYKEERGPNGGRVRMLTRIQVRKKDVPRVCATLEALGVSFEVEERGGEGAVSVVVTEEERGEGDDDTEELG